MWFRWTEKYAFLQSSGRRGCGIESPLPASFSGRPIFFFFAFPPLFIYLFIYFICSEFCHTLKWNSHWFTCVPHPDPPSHLPLHPLPLGLPSEPGPSACLMHPTWAGDLFHPRSYMFRCCSLQTSHPHLLPQCLKDCSIHLCLFFCSAYRVIINIFLNSIYMC